MLEQAYMEFSWLICAADSLALWSWSKDGQRRWLRGAGRGLAGRQRELQGDVGTVLQHSPRQEAKKGLGTGRSGGDREPLSIPRVHTCRRVHALAHTLSPALYKSLWLNASAAAAQV